MPEKPCSKEILVALGPGNNNQFKTGVQILKLQGLNSDRVVVDSSSVEPLMRMQAS